MPLPFASMHQKNRAELLSWTNAPTDEQSVSSTNSENASGLEEVETDDIDKKAKSVNPTHVADKLCNALLGRNSGDNVYFDSKVLCSRRLIAYQTNLHNIASSSFKLNDVLSRFNKERIICLGLLFRPPNSEYLHKL